ncbi:MAG: bifunctional oligoribonuclease/PAP phosphatase NrnA [Planctomycetaceae bacterium]|jgi:phosphoesterase RecJ-like protein|nr:bifunctional oligoribonuclease/PAP phosphatase NrnA [Planctomycetaceae bacterium]
MKSLISQENWSKFITLIDNAQRFLLTAHIRPDGDCIGCELAMAAILRQLGKEVRILNVDPVPPDLKFLDGSDKIEILDAFHDSTWLETADVILVLDTISWMQLGRMKPILQQHKARDGKIIAIDHHAIGDDIGAIVFSNDHAEATGRLVFEASQQLKTRGVRMTPEIATAIFTSLTTDTGWFRFSSVTAETLAVASELIAAGATPHVVYNHLYEQESAGKIRLLGRALAKVELHGDGKLAFTNIRIDDFNQAGAASGDSEDIINQTLEIGGTKMALIVVEQRTGGFKISFRSRCAVDCSKIAAQFGGGGHRQAAGAFQNLPFEELKNSLINAMIEAYPKKIV